VGEFQLIEWIRQQSHSTDKNLILGIGDDAAVIDVPQGWQLVVTTDTLNQDVHFNDDISPTDLGYKSLAVNLSDLAAMGATPRWLLLSISMPAENKLWLESFIKGFLSLAAYSSVSLVGGDTCAGALSITVTAMGLVPNGRAITRSGAHPGDLIVVSGTLGGAAFALARLKKGKVCTRHCLQALYRPVPRVALGTSLVGKATSCIDISDGLLADLGHLANKSGCGAVVDIARLPANESLVDSDLETQWGFQLTGGEDYELCFTLPADLEPDLATLEHELGIQLTVIGHMESGEGVSCIAPDGDAYETKRSGYDHFQ
jgi:thiamine-monophosphate kinase